MIFKGSLKKCDKAMMIWLIWLRMGSQSGLLWTW